MVNPGWSRTASPFHTGELAIQTRLGVQARLDQQGRRVIRDYLTEQHRQFFAQLPQVIVGTVDNSGSLWASILVGEPGFLSSPDDRTLQVVAKPLFGDPLANTLADGIDIGLLGIELHTRRRNRLNGVVTATDATGFKIRVEQSFGNCPQYIQSRRFEPKQSDWAAPKTLHSIVGLGEPERTIVAAADTFFIATAHQDRTAGAATGVDVSHRGGKPGFIRIDDEQTLTIPDFPGNHHFNTFGNLEMNPHAGLLFVNFERGDLLYLTGTAKVVWESDEISAYAGAERLLRFHLERGHRVESSLPLQWTKPEFSPFLEPMGSW